MKYLFICPKYMEAIFKADVVSVPSTGVGVS